MAGNREWNESLFGCLDDWEICFCGCCCLPFLGSCSLCWVPHYMKRGVLRQKYGLQEDPNCADCPATCCCGPCAICQEARFLEHTDGQFGVVAGGARSMTVQPHGYY